MDYEKIKNFQLNLKFSNIKEITLKSQQNSSEDLQKGQKISILFRNTIPEIPSTTYGVFSIYKYPAKFIPQVIAFVLKNYGTPGMKVFDPFAGYGTVGLVAKIYGFNYELWDLNPMLEVIHNTATIGKPRLTITELIELIESVKNSNREFLPNWNNLNYWFPNEFLPVLSKAWGFVHSERRKENKYLLLIPLLKVTRYFSWSDEKVHKLYRSKYSRQKIENLLKGNWKNIFYRMLQEEVLSLYNKLFEYEKLHPKKVEYKVKSGIDTLTTELNEKVDILITSPPYLQAQEYIRSTKLELFWLGYNEAYIKNLSDKEIPYREVPKIKVYSSTFFEYRKKIKEKHLKFIYDQYFYAILSCFSRLGEKVKNYMCIFVGPAKVRNIPIPIDEIIIEHLREFGWKHEVTFIDRILSRVMFESKINPASGREDSRIKTEHLVVLKK